MTDRKNSPPGKAWRIVGLVLAACLLFGLGVLIGMTASDPEPSATEQAWVFQTEDGQTEDGQTEDGNCTHDWSITYATVHHDAVTHTEYANPVYGEETAYHTVCNECGETIDGIAAAHISQTGHAGYSTNVPITNEVLVSEGYAYEVTDIPEYEELVADGMVCTLCGESQSLDSIS